MLVVLTGPVRSGKSACGLALALDSGQPVVIAVGGRADDPEMARRIARHRAGRPDSVRVIETSGDSAWVERVPADACLLVDCLGTILGAELGDLVPARAELADERAEDLAAAAADALVDQLVAREAPTVIVTNEVGWGIVPATPLGRLFRDILGRANRRLTDSADGAWLVVSGRCIDIRSQPQEVSWPQK